MSHFIVIFLTCASGKEAHAIAGTLLKKRLVACANIISGVKSRFWWKGKLDKASEVLVILKARRGNFVKIEHQIKLLHSYDVPEIVALPIVAGSKSYLEWLKSSC